MNWTTYIALATIIGGLNAVRLHKIFLFLDGYKSEHDLRGFLHIGNDYAVFLRKPNPHAKFLTYELYEANNINSDNDKPKLLAISKEPIAFIKEQLKTFRRELYNTKYIDSNVVPGTRVKTLREWQIEKALDSGNKAIIVEKPVLRSIVL